MGSANRWRHDRFKAIITDSNKRQGLSRCVREPDNMYRHIRRILIVSCRSVPVIYLRATCQLIYYLSVLLSGLSETFVRALIT